MPRHYLHNDFISNFMTWGKGAHGIVVSLFILFTSIILHEIAHGWMALRMGDPTARDAGRLNPNPLVHVDPFGSLLLPLILVVTGASTIFGWAKPVPVNPDNYRNRKKGDILVSLAGPATNILLAVSGILLLKILPNSDSSLFLQYFGLQLMLTNTVLFTLNLLPIPPLDGSHLVANLLPQTWADKYRKLGIVGMFLVFMLLNTAVFSELVGTVIRGMLSLFGVTIG